MQFSVCQAVAMASPPAICPGTFPIGVEEDTPDKYEHFQQVSLRSQLGVILKVIGRGRTSPNRLMRHKVGARTFLLGYWMMTTFMLQGVRVRVRGSVCALMLVVAGGAQVLVPAGSGGVPVGEPDRS
jgi:hypothetical protein